MKAAFALAFLTLLALIALLSGCVQQDLSSIGKSREQQAIELASATREASVMQRLNTAFGELKKCSSDELIKEVKRLDPSAPEPTKEQKETARAAIARAQACLPLLKLSVSETGTHVYNAKYSFSFPKDCNAVPELGKVASGAIEVEADVDRQTANLLSGEISSSPSAAEAVELLSGNYGPCSLALLFPGARWDINASIQAPYLNQLLPEGPEGAAGKASAIAITGSS